MAILAYAGGPVAVPYRTPTGTRYMTPPNSQGRPQDPLPAPSAEYSGGFDPNFLLVLGAVAALVILIMVLQ